MMWLDGARRQADSWDAGSVVGWVVGLSEGRGEEGGFVSQGRGSMGEEAYSWGRRELMGTKSGGETMGQDFEHTHGGTDTTSASQGSN